MQLDASFSTTHSILTIAVVTMQPFWWCVYFLNNATDVKILRDQHNSTVGLEVSKSMLLVRYFYPNKSSFVSVEIHLGHIADANLRGIWSPSVYGGDKTGCKMVSVCAATKCIETKH